MNKIKKNKILIVDDEQTVRSLLTRALLNDNYDISTADSISDAIDKLSQDTPDLLIVDKNLPDGSGLDFIKTARNLDFQGEVIVITGYSDMDSAIKSMELSVFRYVKKPFDLDALKTDIKRAFETNNLRSDLIRRTEELEVTNEELTATLDKFKNSEHRRIQSERLASIGYLAASVAHEINTPLSLLSMTIPFILAQFEKYTSSDILVSDPEKAKADMVKMLKSMTPTLEAVELLMVLAQDLHSLGKSDKDNSKQISLYSVVNSALRIVRHKIKLKAKIEVDISEDLMITGKSNRLIQVFINLLTNAARAIEDNNLKNNTVSIIGIKENNSILVKVSDTGYGIPQEKIDLIFNKFTTFSRPGQKEGSGIGLSIVKELVEEHKGTVSVASQVNEGTTFTIKFPLRRVRTSTPPPMTEISTRTTPQNLTRAKRTILFIDQNQDHLDAYQNSFGQMHTVLTLKDHTAANQIIEELKDTLDVVIFEIEDDFDSFNNFYKESTAKHTFLDGHVICTGNDNRLKESLKQIPLVFLSRPFRPSDLLSQIYQIPPRNTENS